MKVEEAKTKVCPFMSEHGEIEIAGLVASKIVNCICGDCMAWVYTNTKSDYPNTRIAEKNQATMRTEVKMICGELDELEKEGYCKRLEQ